MQYTEEEQRVLGLFKKALDKAKIALMSRADSAFFTHVCFSLKHKVEFTIPTAATDGLNIYFNPHFFMSLTAAEQLFLLIHESMHVAYLHFERLMGRDRDIFNQAADHVINLMLIAKGFSMPACGLADPRFVGMSTEQVYTILAREKQQQMPQPTNGMGNDLLPPPDGMTPQEVMAKVENIVVQAAIRSKQEGDKAGTIPGELQIHLDALLNPKLPWQRILSRYMQAKAKNDYSWRKPNRRYFPQYHLPTLYSENLISLAIAVDTSGSVSDSEFQYMVSEVASIFKMMKPEHITLLQFDTQIKSVNKLRNIRDLLGCKFTGRGGTKIEPVMQWAEEHRPQVLLIFTDGGFRNPSVAYPQAIQNNTLWLIHDNPHYTGPFGKTVNYEMG